MRQISEWSEHFDDLDKAGDGNGLISISEFSVGHQNIMKIIGHKFFSGKKEINFNQYCMYMVLISEHDACYEINESRLKKTYDDYCKMRKPKYNGRIEISDFIDKNNDLLTVAQFEDVLQHISNSHSFDFYPEEINYEQFKEFVQSIITFVLMDRDNSRSISPKEIKMFVKFMERYRANYTEADDLRGFFETADEDDDGELNFHEFLLTKYLYYNI